MSDISSERRALRRQRNLESSTEQAPLAVDASPAAATTAAGEDSWRPLDTKAISGVPVYVRGAGGETAEARYVQSRRFEGGRWSPHPIWRNRNGLGMPLRFEPVEYREVGFAPLYQPQQEKVS